MELSNVTLEQEGDSHFSRALTALNANESYSLLSAAEIQV